jgi:hypothetical protein
MLALSACHCRRLQLLICSWLGVLCLSSQVSSAAPARPRDILCHYMSWFQWRTQGGADLQAHWSWGGPGGKHDPSQIGETGLRDICSVYYPRIGVYDSADPDVVDYHILTAKAAGIQGFVVDWYGPGNAVDAALQVLFDRAEALDFKVALCLEEKTCFPGWDNEIADRAGAMKKCAHLVADVVRRYASRKGYWRHGGRPGLFVFNGWGDWPGNGKKTFEDDEWREIARRSGAEALVIIPQHFHLKKGFLRAAFGWCGDRAHVRWVRETGDRRLSDGSLDFYVAPASPGFNDRGVWGWGGKPRLTPRLGAETYAENWRELAKSAADAVQIVTWNDFAEGTVIEPTVQWGHLFIDETERHVGNLTGRPVDTADNILAYQWFLARKRLGAAAAAKLDQIRTLLATGKSQRAAAELGALGMDFPAYVDAAGESPRFAICTAADRARSALVDTIERSLMQSAAASASSFESADHRAVAAIDGRIATRWASQVAEGQWLQLAWPAPVRAKSLVIAWENAYASEYEIQLSADGASWSTAASVSKGQGGTVSLKLPAEPFLFLKLLCRKRGTQWGVSIFEIGLVQ